MHHKILFVDDRTKRIHWALENYNAPVWDLTIATCVPETLRLLSSQEWIVVSLDHDLNGHDFEDPESTGCGMEVVRYLKKCGGWPKIIHHDVHHIPEAPDFWIHSKNIFAAHLMIVELQRMGLSAQWRPVRYEKENMTYDERGNPK